MFFKKRESEKKPEKKVEMIPLRASIVTACKKNTDGILSKLAHKRDEMLHLIAAEGKEEDITEGFEIMADYISSVPWEGIIDQTLKTACYTDINGQWTNRTDVDTAKLLINMQWKIVRVDLNEMMAKVVSLVEGDAA